MSLFSDSVSIYHGMSLLLPRLLDANVLDREIGPDVFGTFRLKLRFKLPPLRAFDNRLFGCSLSNG